MQCCLDSKEHVTIHSLKYLFFEYMWLVTSKTMKHENTRQKKNNM